MSRPTAAVTLRLRLPGAVSAAVGLVAVMAAVGALFPAVGHSIGKINVPKGVANLLGGGPTARSPAATGRRSTATGVAAALAILGWLINSFAPLVSAIAWLKYVSLFYYYAGHDPLTRGVDIPGLAVLGLVTVVLMAVAIVGIDRRDLRA